MLSVPIILGPTASGKTAMALEWIRANRFERPVEIISVDSALIYRHMDIGTAKPSKEELALAPHHLVDIIEPNQTYSAAQFVRQANELIHTIAQRGHQPLLVGGTMLYARSLLYGIDDLPTANPELREIIDQEAAAKGWPALHAELCLTDPVFAATISPNDSQRIQRALEIVRSTGKPMSSFFAAKDIAGKLAKLAWAPDLHVLLPKDRAVLHQRIAQRFDVMLARGLLAEVQALRARGDLSLSLPSMRCVGYRQVWEHLDGKTNFAQMREQGIIATRQLAKRQITWLRGYFLPLESHIPLTLWHL